MCPNPDSLIEYPLSCIYCVHDRRIVVEEHITVMIGLCVRMSVFMSVFEHISGTAHQNFAKFSPYVVAAL